MNKTVHQLGYYERNGKTCNDCKHYPCMVHDVDFKYELPLCPDFIERSKEYIKQCEEEVYNAETGLGVAQVRLDIAVKKLKGAKENA